MNTELQNLRAVSARLGSDPLLVQAAGGNTSIKLGDTMWIKASGTWLMDAERKEIFVPLDLPALTQALAADSPDCESCLSFVRQDMNPSGLRPSIETSVHGLMPQRVVLHVHCVNTIAWAIRADAEVQLAKYLAAFNWSFIPYARPGLQLARCIKQNLKPGSDVMVLGNHGLAVAADDVAEADNLLRAVISAVTCEVRPPQGPDMLALQRAAADTAFRPAEDALAHAIAFDARAISEGCTQVFYPDHAVFLGTLIPQSITSGAPAIVLPGKGVLVHRNAKPSIESMLRCLGDVFRRTAENAPLKALTTEEIGQLLNWDAEKYRQALKN